MIAWALEGAHLVLFPPGLGYLYLHFFVMIFCAPHATRRCCPRASRGAVTVLQGKTTGESQIPWVALHWTKEAIMDFTKDADLDGSRLADTTTPWRF
jgi:hypothetical protein